MKTSIIIPNWNTDYCLRNCVESIKKFTKDYELIIVDNGSKREEIRQYIKEVADKYIFNKTNLGFPKACNQGAKIAEGGLICFLNSDTIVTENWLSNMIKTMENSEKCVAVGPLGNPEFRTDEKTGTIFGHQQYEGQYNKDTKVKFLVGYCLLIKKEIFDKILFDEDFELGMYEDNILCEKINKLGYEMWVSSKSLVKHIGSVTFRINDLDYKELLEKNKKIYDKKIKEIYNE